MFLCLPSVTFDNSSDFGIFDFTPLLIENPEFKEAGCKTADSFPSAFHPPNPGDSLVHLPVVDLFLLLTRVLFFTCVLLLACLFIFIAFPS